jgi:hypothetical protein
MPLDEKLDLAYVQFLTLSLTFPYHITNRNKTSSGANKIRVIAVKIFLDFGLQERD